MTSPNTSASTTDAPMRALHAAGDEPTFEPATCAVHGDFMQRTLDTGLGHVIRGECPACRERRIELATSAERREREAVALLQRRQMLSAAGIPPRFANKGFDGYEPVTVGAQKNLRVCKGFVEQFPDQLANGTTLVLTGQPGTGKTHLAAAVVRGVIEQHGHQARYIGASDLMRSIKETYRAGSARTEREVIAEFANIDLLVIDEVGIQVGSDTEKMLMFEVFNGRYAQMKPTVLLSNLTAEELAAYLGDRIMDRFREGGAVLVFNWQSRRGAA